MAKMSLCKGAVFQPVLLKITKINPPVVRLVTGPSPFKSFSGDLYLFSNFGFIVTLTGILLDIPYSSSFTKTNSYVPKNPGPGIHEKVPFL